MILKRELFNGVQSEWSKQDDRFPSAHEMVAADQTASKAASFEFFRSPSAWLLRGTEIFQIGTRRRGNLSSSLIQGLKAR